MRRRGLSPLARGKGVDPVQIGEPHPQAVARRRVLDAERYDKLAAFSSDRDLTADVIVLVAAFGEDQQHRPAAFDRVDDLVVEWPARVHVARRDPASDPTPLQLVDDFGRGRAILADMADEQKQVGPGHEPRNAYGLSGPLRYTPRPTTPNRNDGQLPAVEFLLSMSDLARLLLPPNDVRFRRRAVNWRPVREGPVCHPRRSTIVSASRG
jgi:hypothetical protein